MGEEKTAKKRPRDILASLDAAFAPSAAKATSKYTVQAAQQSSAAAAQQAYQHSKHKKKKKSSQEPAPTNNAKQAASGGGQSSKSTNQAPAKEPYDPLYGRLDVDTLQVGLKNCSLSAKVESLRKTSALHATLKKYIGSFTKEGNATAMTDKLKNKALQFDNPIRTTDASKRAVNRAQAQSAKLLSARQRRKLGMHLMKSDAIEYNEAEKLCKIWRRYARDVISSDFTGDQTDEAARSSRLQSKLRTIDLSGCPIEACDLHVRDGKHIVVIKARNPSSVGTVGIIVADKAQVLQICVPERSKVTTLPKQELRFRVPLDDDKSFFVEGRWLLNRPC